MEVTYEVVNCHYAAFAGLGREVGKFGETRVLVG
jgi:hypothetical protein